MKATKLNSKHTYDVHFEDEAPSSENVADNVILAGHELLAGLEELLERGWTGELTISISRIKLGKGTWE